MRRRPYLLFFATFAACGVASAQPERTEPPITSVDPAASTRPSTSERVGPSDPSLAVALHGTLT